MQPFFNYLVRDLHCFANFSTDDEVKDIQQFACISPTCNANKAGRLSEADVAFLQFNIFRYSTVKELQEVVFLQRFQHIKLTTGEQRAYNFERGFSVVAPMSVLFPFLQPLR